MMELYNDRLIDLLAESHTSDVSFESWCFNLKILLVSHIVNESHWILLPW